MSIILLLEANVQRAPHSCEDSLRHCLDSIRAVSSYLSTIKSNGPTESTNVPFSTSNLITVCIFAISVIGTWITLAWKGGQLMQKITHIGDTLTDMKAHTVKIPVLETKVNTIWADKFSQSNSPMALNERGKKVLDDSGIDKIVESNYDFIKSYVLTASPQNAYEAQEYVKIAVSNLVENPALKNELENSAFRAGVDVFAILFVGALYIRDKVLSELGFSIGDIDTHAPGTK